VDDDGHTLRRGVRTAVCEKTFEIYNRPPYCEDVEPVPPTAPVRPEDAVPYDCRRNAVRDPQETKNAASTARTQLPDADCCSAGGCW
jgi:hypothetical protein